jgi:hypothetical protein
MTALQKPLSLASAFRRAAALFVVDGLIIGWGFSAFVGLWTLFVSLPRALRDTDRERRRRRFARAAVYLGVVLLVFAWLLPNHRMAERRANKLVAAVKAYKHEHQRYPATLEELVPRYVDEVPVAMYIVLSSHFFYYNLPDRPLLFYVFSFPFGRMVYNFEKDRWSQLD